jgi:tetratricopeptide (TPR) repeat protein
LESGLTLAHYHAKEGDRLLAERLYLEIVASGVSDVRAYCNLGVLALLEKRSEEAVGWLEQAVQADPDHAQSHLNLEWRCSLGSVPLRRSRCWGWGFIMRRRRHTKPHLHQKQ